MRVSHREACGRWWVALAVAGMLGTPGAARAALQDSAPPEQGAEKTQSDEEGDDRRLRRRLVDATAQEAEWTPDLRMTPAEEVRELVQRGDQALAAGRIEEADGGALALFTRALGIEANNAAANAGIDRAVAALVQRGESAIAAGRFDEAVRLSGIASRHRAQAPAVRALAAKVAAGREMAQKLAEAQRHIAAGRFVEPANGSALQVYRGILDREPGNAAALQGLQELENLMVARASAAAEAGNYAEADRLLAQAASVQPGSQRVQDAGAQIVELRQRRAQGLEQDIVIAIQGGQYEQAEALIGQLATVSVQEMRAEELRTQLDNARNYASHKPGDVLRDPIASGGQGPEMVVIPLGSFQMGSPNNEAGRQKNEGPRFEVRFSRGFAVSRTEITVGQFRQFINATGYVTASLKNGKATVYDETTGTLAEKSGVTWQDDHLGRKAKPELPVIHISWEDARAYAEWLSRETGKRYRLPTEAEFEYALRAGSTTRYPWGDGEPDRVVGNFTGDQDRSESKRSWSNAFKDYDDGHWGPAPVASYEPNPFGLYDMAGNVSEWTEDCWHDSYQRAPADGSAWVNPGCARRVIRGASWASAPDQVRSAFRLSAAPTATNPRLGLRVVREF